MISVVIPNYNSGSLLSKNLPKLFDLLKKSKLEYEVIVTDDCSTDDSLTALTSLKSLTVVTSLKNTGFGSNVDRGIQVARGEIVFILNAIDALPEKPEYFSLMLEHFKDPKVFSVAAVKKDETGTHGSGQIYFEKGFFLHRRKLVTSHQSLATTSWADGGAQAIRKDYYLKIGGFDPIYKFYWEDVDLGYRAWKAGYKIIYEPRAVLLHAKSEGPIAKRYNEHERKILNLRNQFIFTWKNGNLKRQLLNFLWLPYYLRQKDFFVAFWQALISMLDK